MDPFWMSSKLGLSWKIPQLTFLNAHKPKAQEQRLPPSSQNQSHFGHCGNTKVLEIDPPRGESLIFQTGIYIHHFFSLYKCWLLVIEFSKDRQKWSIPSIFCTTGQFTCWGINVPIHPIFQMRLGEQASYFVRLSSRKQTEIKACGRAGDNEELVESGQGTRWLC